MTKVLAILLFISTGSMLLANTNKPCNVGGLVESVAKGYDNRLAANVARNADTAATQASRRAAAVIPDPPVNPNAVGLDLILQKSPDFNPVGGSLNFVADNGHATQVKLVSILDDGTAEVVAESGANIGKRVRVPLRNLKLNESYDVLLSRLNFASKTFDDLARGIPVTPLKIPISKVDVMHFQGMFPNLSRVVAANDRIVTISTIRNTLNALKKKNYARVLKADRAVIDAEVAALEQVAKLMADDSAKGSLKALGAYLDHPSVVRASLGPKGRLIADSFLDLNKNLGYKTIRDQAGDGWTKVVLDGTLGETMLAPARGKRIIFRNKETGMSIAESYDEFGDIVGVEMLVQREGDGIAAFAYGGKPKVLESETHIFSGGQPTAKRTGFHGGGKIRGTCNGCHSKNGNRMGSLVPQSVADSMMQTAYKKSREFWAHLNKAN